MGGKKKISVPCPELHSGIRKLEGWEWLQLPEAPATAQAPCCVSLLDNPSNKMATSGRDPQWPKLSILQGRVSGSRITVHSKQWHQERGSLSSWPAFPMRQRLKSDFHVTSSYLLHQIVQRCQDLEAEEEFNEEEVEGEDHLESDESSESEMQELEVCLPTLTPNPHPWLPLPTFVPAPWVPQLTLFPIRDFWLIYQQLLAQRLTALVYSSEISIFPCYPISWPLAWNTFKASPPLISLACFVFLLRMSLHCTWGIGEKKKKRNGLYGCYVFEGFFFFQNDAVCGEKTISLPSLHLFFIN